VKPAWKGASEKQLIYAGYIATLAVIAAGIAISLYTDAIAAIWNPINFALGATLLAPALFAPYWWRISGSAYCASGAATLPVAICIHVFTDWHAVVYDSRDSLYKCLYNPSIIDLAVTSTPPEKRNPADTNL
jgi:hypothetical protein